MMAHSQTYAARRAAFVRQMGEGVAIFPAAPPAIRSHDTEYRYRQDNDLYYLTGFPEPESLCLLSPQHDTERFVLFVRPRDKDKEVWTGRRFGTEGAKEVFGADAAYTIDRLDEILPQHLATAEKVYYALGRNEPVNAKVLDLMNRSRLLRQRSGRGPVSLIDPGEILHELRLYKSAEEIGLMRRAVAASAAAHQAAVTLTRPGMCEYEIEALLEFHFRRLGATGPAYPSIVASGGNATILHYIENSRQMQDGELLLIDAAAEYACYCSDVTRTFPVGRRFSPVQRDIYALVLSAQKQAVAMIRPGVRFSEVHRHATEILVDGLRDFGLLSGQTQEIVEKGEHRRFFMHGTSHWLGMDVHDVGKYKVGEESRVLEPGMVLTVEPGLYIAEDAEGVEERYRGIGVRIEDDVLVTAAGHEVPTAAIAKEIDDLEALRRGHNG
ncbi:MAG TPA: aminopeptidase P N-terminal domain-containing protein [Candidatus Binatia bacterium]|nr:aminopeptidase P N-terminal domain-containing protein [Candidatus Binatia bacterium]